MSETWRILAIHAHPDDIELQCAGVLFRLKELGHTVICATMTPGDCGSAEMGPLEIANVRRAEAAKAAELLGAEYHCLEFRDLSIVHDNPSRQRVTEFFRQVRPDIVLTAPPVDYMSDHEMTSRLVRDACFNASVPNYTTGMEEPAAPLDGVPYLYYVDPVEGTDLYGSPIEPGIVLDITEVYPRKREMLACHESQRAWLLKQHGIDEYLDAQERWARERGKLLGVAYAEAFRQHKGHPHPHDDKLSELLAASRTS